MPTLHGRILAVVVGMLWLGTTEALPEVAHLRNGRVLQISGYRLEGERVVLLMPGGGEVAAIAVPSYSILQRAPAPTPARSREHSRKG